MKFLSKILFLVLILSFFVPTNTAMAGDYVSDAIEALKLSNVYVAPGTEGTDIDTGSKLTKFLGPTDNIVLVLLPSEALNGTDLYTIARTISQGLDNQKTIGLAVGRDVFGYSVILPDGLASDKMHRASSVSNDPITALITFTQNIHSWQASNPQPTPTSTPEPTPTPRPTMTPIEFPKAEDISWPIWALLAIGGLATILLFASKAVKSGKKLSRKMSLEPNRALIEKIEGNVAKIRESRVRKDLERACLAAYGLLEIFQQSDTYVGKIESEFPHLLSYVNRQVLAFINHESGTRPLQDQYLSDLRSILLNYDSLFVKLQENDPATVELLTSMIHSKSTMIASLGYLPEDK